VSPEPTNAELELIHGEEGLAVAEEQFERSIRNRAAEFAPHAVDTLGAFAQGKKVNESIPSAAVIRQSARDIIEFAGGRPETRDPRIGGVDFGGVNIYITQFGDGKPVEKIVKGVNIDIDPANLPDRTSKPNKSITRTYEVQADPEPEGD
jgi:hypothetical protein